MDLPPSQTPPQTTAVPVAPRASSGCGCFGFGCLSLLALGFLGLVAILATGWFLFGVVVDKFTSAGPVQIALQPVTNEQYAAAESKLDQLRTALRSTQAATVAFSADDLNALLQRDPKLALRQVKMHIAIANSVAEVEMSMPLKTIDVPRIRHRWFNGSASFTFLYAQEAGFEFDVRWLEANGHRLTGSALEAGAASFNHSFTNRFKEAMRGEGDDFWRNVKTMTLDRDQLVVMTKAP